MLLCANERGRCTVFSYHRLSCQKDDKTFSVVPLFATRQDNTPVFFYRWHMNSFGQLCTIRFISGKKLCWRKQSGTRISLYARKYRFLTFFASQYDLQLPTSFLFPFPLSFYCFFLFISQTQSTPIFAVEITITFNSILG